VHNQPHELTLRTILWKTINVHEDFPDNYQLFVLPKEDQEFVKTQLEKIEDAEEYQLDSFAKLFIAFYFDSIPTQIIENLKLYPASGKSTEGTREYLLAIAGLLHEVKVAIDDLSEILLPYLSAYHEFISGEEFSQSEDKLLHNFKANVEKAIQTVISY
jgi:hypothetical protein